MHSWGQGKFPKQTIVKSFLKFLKNRFNKLYLLNMTLFLKLGKSLCIIITNFILKYKKLEIIMAEVLNIYNYIREEFFKNKKEKIYHYTSPYGLKSIIENKKIWFSDIKFMNDEREILYTYDLVVKCLGNLTDINKEFSNHILNYYNNIKNLNKNPYKHSFFISCFSTDNDNLSLWNNYTKNENKIGYCIEFDSKFIEDYIEKLNLDFDTSMIEQREVIYNKEEQINLISQALHLIDQQDDDILMKCFTFNSIIYDYCTFFKHPSFKVEKEYRIIIPDFHTVKPLTRIVNGLIVPYVEIDFKEERVKSITLSPTNKQNIAIDGIESLLSISNYNLSLDNIYKSQIPLRY